ncbi:MAG: PIN domain-containing protein [Moorellaceae bacterium]
MRGILLDTGILVDYLRYKRSSRPKDKRQAFLSHQAAKLIEGAIEEKIPLFISVHTWKELIQYPNISEQEERRILADIPVFCKIVNTTKNIAKVAALLSRASPEFRKHHVEDCYIAAVAIVRQLPLYTTNPKDFNYVKNEKLKRKLKIVQPYQYVE